jgi:hypothetical protein
MRDGSDEPDRRADVGAGPDPITEGYQARKPGHLI